MTRHADFLPESKIETATLDLLAAYGTKYGEITSPPVPVEEILEAHLEMDVGFADLPSVFHDSRVLGAIWIQHRTVRIDESLDPTIHPAKEGRFRFTVAHETGHWELHRHLYLVDPDQQRMFTEKGEPIVCRSSSKERAEWQADCFAGCLLMPKQMIYDAWKVVYGGFEPYVAKEEIEGLNALWGLGPDEFPTIQISRDMARVFSVSAQAMQIRLIRLGLVRKEAPPPDLFSS